MIYILTVIVFTFVIINILDYRLLAFAVAGLYVLLKKESNHGCPLYKFSYASFSNIMSSWFQYEALKFVTFPTQVKLILTCL